MCTRYTRSVDRNSSVDRILSSDHVALPPRSARPPKAHPVLGQLEEISEIVKRVGLVRRPLQRSSRDREPYGDRLDLAFGGDRSVSRDVAAVAVHQLVPEMPTLLADEQTLPHHDRPFAVVVPARLSDRGPNEVQIRSCRERHPGTRDRAFRASPPARTGSGAVLAVRPTCRPLPAWL
jgi:hypothetical protein